MNFRFLNRTTFTYLLLFFPSILFASQKEKMTPWQNADISLRTMKFREEQWKEQQERYGKSKVFVEILDNFSDRELKKLGLDDTFDFEGYTKVKIGGTSDWFDSGSLYVVPTEHLGRYTEGPTYRSCMASTFFWGNKVVINGTFYEIEMDKILKTEIYYKPNVEYCNKIFKTIGLSALAATGAVVTAISIDEFFKQKNRVAGLWGSMSALISGFCGKGIYNLWWKDN